MKCDPFLVCRCISRWFSTFAKIAIFISTPYILAIKDRAECCGSRSEWKQGKGRVRDRGPVYSLAQEREEGGKPFVVVPVIVPVCSTMSWRVSSRCQSPAVGILYLEEGRRQHVIVGAVLNRRGPLCRKSIIGASECFVFIRKQERPYRGVRYGLSGLWLWMIAFTAGSRPRSNRP